jgi:hypothetical protein
MRNAVICTPHIILVGVKIENEMGWVCSVDCGGEWRVHGFGGETWGKETTGISRRRWEDNIRMDFQEVGCEGMDWIGLA